MNWLDHYRYRAAPTEHTWGTEDIEAFTRDVELTPTYWKMRDAANLRFTEALRGYISNRDLGDEQPNPFFP